MLPVCPSRLLLGWFEEPTLKEGPGERGRKWRAHRPVRYGVSTSAGSPTVASNDNGSCSGQRRRSRCTRWDSSREPALLALARQGAECVLTRSAVRGARLRPVRCDAANELCRDCPADAASAVSLGLGTRQQTTWVSSPVHRLRVLRQQNSLRTPTLSPAAHSSMFPPVLRVRRPASSGFTVVGEASRQLHEVVPAVAKTAWRQLREVPPAVPKTPSASGTSAAGAGACRPTHPSLSGSTFGEGGAH